MDRQTNRDTQNAMGEVGDEEREGCTKRWEGQCKGRLERVLKKGTEGRREVQKDGWMDGWMDGWRDGMEGILEE